MVGFANSLGELDLCDSSFTSDNIDYYFLPLCHQILKGKLEGASHILPALRVLSSLLSSCSDSIPLYSFCREAGLPGLLLSLLRHTQQSNSIQQVSTVQRASKDFQEFLRRFLFFELPSLFGQVAFFIFFPLST